MDDRVRCKCCSAFVCKKIGLAWRQMTICEMNMYAMMRSVHAIEDKVHEMTCYIYATEGNVHAMTCDMYATESDAYVMHRKSCDIFTLSIQKWYSLRCAAFQLLGTGCPSLSSS